MDYFNETFRGEPKQPGRDNHAHAVEADGAQYFDCTFDANGASEAFKASRRWGVHVNGGTSRGGVEDCHDYVRGGDLNVVGHTFERGPAPRDVTVKGSFRNGVWNNCPGLRFIVAGDYTKYDLKAIYPDGTVRKARPWACARPPVRDCQAWSATRRPIIVLNLHSEPWKGEVINLRLPFAPLHRLVVATYFWVRSLFPEKLPPAPEQFVIDPREL